jgi:hypothetical protein
LPAASVRGEVKAQNKAGFRIYDKPKIIFRMLIEEILDSI